MLNSAKKYRNHVRMRENQSPISETALGPRLLAWARVKKTKQQLQIDTDQSILSVLAARFLSSPPPLLAAKSNDRTELNSTQLKPNANVCARLQQKQEAKSLKTNVTGPIIDNSHDQLRQAGPSQTA